MYSINWHNTYRPGSAQAAGVRIISIKTEFDTLKNVTSTADLALNLALTGIRKSFESTDISLKMLHGTLKGTLVNK